MNLRILHCSFINHQSTISIEVIFSVIRLKNVKTRGKRRIPRKKDEFRGKKANSAVNSAARLVKIQIPRLGSKFRGPRKTVGPINMTFVYTIGACNKMVLILIFDQTEKFRMF